MEPKPRPYCPCAGCQQRTKEKLDNADHSDVRRWIAALREHLAERKETDENIKPR